MTRLVFPGQLFLYTSTGWLCNNFWDKLPGVVYTIFAVNWNNSFLLPFGFVDSLGWVTPAIVTFITYTFTALEALADELEEPFGMAQNDLAPDVMSKTIENTLREMNGEVIVQETPAGDYLS
jgi:predicted membrane chloride channel (bestrophin family)